jgi:uncharacterized protein (DUF2062 family)
MRAWMRSHRRLTDLAVVGGAVVVAESFTDELGVITALAVGMALILIANLLLAMRSSD